MNLVWEIKYRSSALKDMKKIHKQDREEIHRYLKERVALAKHPKDFGKAMLYEHSGLWRYRIGKFRVICRLEGSVLKVLVVRVGKRDKVYQ